MKKVVLILALVVSAYTIQAQEVKWYTIEEAVELNKTQPRKIMVDVYTDWCGWCKVMDKNTFKQPVVAQYLNENFYPVKFNAEQKDTVNILGQTFTFVSSGKRGSHQLAAALGATGYPYVVFLDEGMNIITSLPGYTKAPQFDKVINYINGEHYKNKDFDTWAATYTTSVQSE